MNFTLGQGPTYALRARADSLHGVNFTHKPDASHHVGSPSHWVAVLSLGKEKGLAGYFQVVVSLSEFLLKANVILVNAL